MIRSSSRVLSASFCALLAVGLLVPALARAAWSTPFHVSLGGQYAFEPQVAVDADGDAVFTWLRHDGSNYRVQARARSAAGALSAVHTLSADGQDASSPQVAVDADGDAVFTWMRFDGTANRVQARARSAAGVLSPVQTLSGAAVTAFSPFPQVAVDADGDAVFTWRYTQSTPCPSRRIQGRARSAAGALSAVQHVSQAGECGVDFPDAIDPQVAVDADGDAVFTWALDYESGQSVQTRARSAGGVLSPVQTLSDASGLDAFQPQVAVDADGDAVFTWRRGDGANNQRVQARARSAVGTLSAVQNLSDVGQSAYDPQVAVDATGDAVFTWLRYDGTDDRAQARARFAGGALSPVQTLSPSGGSADEARVAVDADGDAVFTWRRFNPNFVYQVQARTRSAVGALGAVQSLSGGVTYSAYYPQVAVDATGDAIAVWQRVDELGFDRIQASTGP